MLLCLWVKPPKKPTGLKKPPPWDDPWGAVHPREEDAVIVIVGLLAAGEWRSGISTSRYSKLWGVPPATVQQWLAAARAVQRIEDRPSILGVITEMRRHMCRKVYQLDDEGDSWHSLLGAKHVCDVQLGLLKSSRDETAQAALARLVDMSDEELKIEAEKT